MKKLSLLLTVFISMATFANTNIPAWDKPLTPFHFKKSMLVEPNVIGFGIDPATIGGQRKMHVWIQWDAYTTNVWLWEFGHAGYWQDMGGWDTKVFHLYTNGGSRYDYYYNLLPQDNPTWGWWNDYYFAPLQP